MKKYILLLFTTLSFAQASNQMVTFTQAQSLGFALKSGQSHVTSNQCMTKSDALAKYNVDADAMSSYANNQLVPRSAWVSVVVGIPFSTNYYYFNNKSEVCASGSVHSHTEYTINGLMLGARIYSDQACTKEIHRTGEFFYSAIENSVKKAYRLDANRVVDYVESCP